MLIYEVLFELTICLLFLHLRGYSLGFAYLLFTGGLTKSWTKYSWGWFCRFCQHDFKPHQSILEFSCQVCLIIYYQSLLFLDFHVCFILIAFSFSSLFIVHYFLTSFHTLTYGCLALLSFQFSVTICYGNFNISDCFLTIFMSRYPI